MDYKEILNLMKEMNKTDLTKIEIEENGTKICMEKAAPVVNAAQPVFQQPVLSQPAYIPGYASGLMQDTFAHPQMSGQGQPAASKNHEGQASAAKEGNETSAEEQNAKKLVSPMVGTFYSSSAPDKPPFVKVGDKVKKGQTICIIEAMKLMNEIEADHDGEVIKVLVNNEQMVEFGQALFLIK